MLVTVVCDNCDWRFEKQTVRRWYKKECPKCGHKYIIDDQDTRIYKFIRLIKLISDVIKFFCPWMKTKTVTIHSAEIKRRINHVKKKIQNENNDFRL